MSLKNKKVDVEKIIENPVTRTEKPVAPKENILGWLAYVSGQTVIVGICLLIALYILDWLGLTLEKEIYTAVLLLVFFVGILLFPICVKMDIRKQQINILKSVNRIILLPYLMLGIICTAFIITLIFKLKLDLVFTILFVLNAILYVFSFAYYIWTKHKLGYRRMIMKSTFIIAPAIIFIIWMFGVATPKPTSQVSCYHRSIDW